MKKLTKEEFIENARQKHGNKYDYSLVEYKNNRTKIKIICPTHGIFEQIASSHIGGYGCIKCNMDNSNFIERSIKTHGNKYDYSLVKYCGSHKKVKIICPTHGEFEQRPNGHLKGYGCTKCKIITNDIFIEKAKNIHGDKYDYSLVDYKNTYTKIKIVCTEHGIFEQTPNSHLSAKQGCPKCPSNTESKGEKKIREYFKENNIKYNPQKTFDDCSYKSVLRFDFYLPDYNLCIEYNGIQHYIPVDFFGGIVKFNIGKERFEIKQNFCKENKIDLLIIKYDDKIIEKLINQLACCSKDIS